MTRMIGSVVRMRRSRFRRSKQLWRLLCGGRRSVCARCREGGRFMVEERC